MFTKEEVEIAMGNDTPLYFYTKTDEDGLVTWIQSGNAANEDEIAQHELEVKTPYDYIEMLNNKEAAYNAAMLANQEASEAKAIARDNVLTQLAEAAGLTLEDVKAVL